jgi:hypothetical protein
VTIKFTFLEDVHNFAKVTAARPEHDWKKALLIRV